MRWIKYTEGLEQSPEVLAIAAELDRNPYEITGRLLAVWSRADAHAEIDSDLSGIVAVKAGDPLAMLDSWGGGLPGLGKAMESVGWAVAGERRLTLPNFGLHNGETARERAQKAVRQARHRTRGARSATKAPRERHESATTVALEAPRKRHASATREEKRREEKKSNETPSYSGKREKELNRRRTLKGGVGENAAAAAAEFLSQSGGKEREELEAYIRGLGVSQYAEVAAALESREATDDLVAAVRWYGERQGWDEKKVAGYFVARALNGRAVPGWEKAKVLS